MSYNSHFLYLVTSLDTMMSGFLHHKKDLGYGYRWTFQNGQWVDLIDYKNKGNMILRFGRGAWLCRQYPMLVGIFDSVEKVIAKMIVKDVVVFEEKHNLGVFELLEKAPKGIGAFD